MLREHLLGRITKMLNWNRNKGVLIEEREATILYLHITLQMNGSSLMGIIYLWVDLGTHLALPQ